MTDTAPTMDRLAMPMSRRVDTLSMIRYMRFRGVMAWYPLAGIAAALCGSTQVARADIEVHVSRIGFPARNSGDNGGSAPVVRRGRWTPLVVRVSLGNEASFDGYLRAGQLDVDGDECFDSVEVHLRQGPTSTLVRTLYVLANNTTDQGRIVVELFDEQGQAVEVVSEGYRTYRSPPDEQTGGLPLALSDDTALILSITDGTMGKVANLVRAAQFKPFRRSVSVAHISAGELPELWIGLEVVDFIVWDDAHPELLSQRQRSALLEWVRFGGTLLIAASRSAGALKQTSDINDILPVELGDVVPVNNLPEVRRVLLGEPKLDEKSRRGSSPPWWSIDFPASVPVVQCSLRDGAHRVPRNDRDQPNVVTRRRLGAGHVVFSAVTLKDLFSGQGESADFFRTVFRLGTLDAEREPPAFQSLFPYVINAIGFTDWGSLYFLFAVIASLSYVLVATFGTWALLGRRGWRRHSWSAFAVVALVASLLSVFSVNAVRGFGGRILHQISVIDADAGSTRGRGTVFFGLKTGLDQQLDLWLASDPLGEAEPSASSTFLRPIPVSSDYNTTLRSFADPGPYRLIPSSGVLKDVRIRATLKRFEGRWEGALRGSLRGEISVRGTTILEGSYLVNDLGVDLHDCYLLHPVVQLNRRGSPRADSIYTYSLGTLAGGGGRIDLAALCYQLKGTETVQELKRRSRLAERHRTWGATFRTVFSKLGYGALSNLEVPLGQEKNALLLLSTVGDFDYEDVSTVSQLGGRWAPSRDGLRQLDLQGHLSLNELVVIGFTDDAGPCRLFGRRGDRPYRWIEPEPSRSWTMYRFRIPATYLGRGSEDDEEENERIR